MADHWSPVRPTGAERAALVTLGAVLSGRDPRQGAAMIPRTERAVTRAVAPVVGEVLARDRLPLLAHLVNGWGDARVGGRSLLARTARFIHEGPDGPCVLQASSEGESHPWQTVAYAAMAGVDLGADPGGGVGPLGALAARSRTLGTDAGEELGHFLFALAFIAPADHPPDFSLASGRVVTLEDIAALTVRAHLEGHFDVCWKIHSTEGLCAAAARIPVLAPLRGVAQGFLDGQMELLALYAAQLVDRGDARDSIRATLALGRSVESQLYYAGHQLELAALAALLGYRVSSETWAVVDFVIEQCSRMLDSFLDRMAIVDWFPYLGHFRRAVTLVAARDAPGRGDLRARLAAYTVDFDKRSDEGEEERRQEPSRDDLVVTAAAPGPDPRFAAVIQEYDAAAPDELRTWGGYAHFRRIRPSAWPRCVHYELLHGDGTIGVELHVETDSLSTVAGVVRELGPRVQEQLAPRPVQWEPEWHEPGSRLRVQFDENEDPVVVARAMRALIVATVEVVDAVTRGALLD